MPSQHKHSPIPFRPAEGDRAWLLDLSARTGRPVNAILREALARYREILSAESPAGNPATDTPPAGTTADSPAEP